MIFNLQKRYLIFFILFTSLIHFGCEKSSLRSSQALPQTSLSETAPTSEDLEIFIPFPDPLKLDSSCLTNSHYDACIYIKNPIAQNQSPLLVGDRTQLTQLQTFGVQLKNLIDPNALASTSIAITTSASTNAKKSDSSAWRCAYNESCNDNHYVAQVMTYYWLTEMEETLTRITGVFYAKNKNIIVDAFVNSLANNAYWDSRKIVLGGISTDGGYSSSSEMALESDFTVHEMGHANLDFATNGGVYGDVNAYSQSVCITAEGCASAINEGQADFHAMLVFPQSVAIGDYLANNLDGFKNGHIHRNPIKNATFSAQEAFADSGGEVHSMGSIYASILYSIYTDPKMKKSDFEKLFSLHLQKLTKSTRFKEACMIFVADNQAFFGGKYTEMIRLHFINRGVEL